MRGRFASPWTASRPANRVPDHSRRGALASPSQSRTNRAGSGVTVLGRRLWVGLAIALAPLVLFAAASVATPPQAAAATLLSVDFNGGSNGFSYVDDPFGTNQPSYASGAWTSSGGYGGSGGLQVNLGGINSNTILNMSGGWSRTVNLAAAETGVALTYRYRLQQTSQYEFNEFSRVRMTFDGTEHGRGTKSFVDHVGGDGSSSQGNSSTYLPTTEWQQHTVFLGDLSAGNHTMVLGGFNNQKNASNESTIVVIDDVTLTSGNEAPATTIPEQLVDRLELATYKSNIQSLASYGDRCRMSSCPGSPSNSFLNAQAWVADELEEMGYTPQYHNTTYVGSSITNLYATKIGSTNPDRMYIVSAHLDGRGGGGAADDDGSGVALVMEVARVLAGADVQTADSVRFIFWDREEAGLHGSNAYVAERRLLQGVENPPGSGQYPEPEWLGILQHDMMLYDHGAGSPSSSQSAFADIDVEWRAGTTEEAASRDLALAYRYLTGMFAADYPSTAYNYSTNTDDTPFHPWTASISVRENRRSLTSGGNAEWINPNYHQASDLYGSYSEDDFRLGFNAAQSTLGAVATFAGANIAVPSDPPVADPQSVTADEDVAEAITLTGSDPEDDPLTYSIVDNPSHGSLSGTPPDVTYTSDTNFNGDDSFTFRVHDGYSYSPAATVDIEVAPVQDLPIASAQTVATTIDTAVDITLEGSDPDDDPITFELGDLPDHGELTGTAPDVTYTPDTGYTGTDSFTFVVDDGIGDSAPAAVSIAVNPAGPSVVFEDDFETDKGWTVDPSDTDTATLGQWERGDPEGTNSSGPKQLGDAFDGTNDLVTGRLAGSGAGSYDIDGGVTSVRSPDIDLPAGQEIDLELRYYFAHGTNSSTADSLRISVVGSSTSVLLEELGAGNDDDAAWALLEASLDAFAGQTVHLLVEAADASGASLVEAAVDAVSIIAEPPPTVILETGFDAGADGFEYSDDGFRGTNAPAYASGAYSSSGGSSGGGLTVAVGGIDDDDISGMSGGWQRTFSLSSPAEVLVELAFNLTQTSEYESSEWSDALVSIDGTLYGVPPNDYAARIVGNGNGGGPITTGWFVHAFSAGTLAAGTHTIRIGGYNNLKTLADESTELRIDDVVISAR